MKKEKIKNILLIVIVALVTSFVTAYGVSSTFDSSNVCYQVDSNTGASVQDTIDDLYGRASDYSTLNNKLDGYFQYDPTSYFIGSDLRLGANSTSDVGPGLILYKNSNTRGSRFVYNASTGVTSIDAYNSSGTAGQGTLNLAGNPVTINGTNIGDLIKIKYIKIACSSMTKNMDLTSYITIDSGYKFLAWQALGTSDGWISSFPIYITSPFLISGGPWWNGDLNTTGHVRFFYYEILS